MDNQITHLTKIEIKGLWDKYDIVWDLNSDVNVLAGINGSGKTTIINCIFELFFYDVILTNDRNTAKSVQLNFNDGESIFFEEGISLSHSNEGDFKKLRPNMNLIRTFDIEAKPQELLKKANDEVNTELDFELWILQKEYLNYQVDIGKKLRANKGSPDDNTTYFHDKFIEIINDLFLETNKKVNQDENELEFLLGEQEINVYQLSSGEKQLLIILLTVLVQDNKPSILLMDEPEISLHIEWQRKLIKYIRVLNPNAQIIIATHSPDIIVHGWLDNVFNLQDLIVKDNTRL